jgi:hypothetical protein
MKQKTKSKVFGLKYLEKPSSSLVNGSWFHIEMAIKTHRTATNNPTSGFTFIPVSFPPYFITVPTTDPAEPDEEMDYGDTSNS